MRAVLVAFSACLLLAPASAEDHVTAVTDGDWEATIVDGPWMVEFYAPWCAHCKAFAPVWAEVAEKLAPTGVKFAKVDATYETASATKFSVKSYPKIFFLPASYAVDGQYREFKGGRNADAVEKFVQKITGPPIAELSADAVDEFKQQSDVVFVSFGAASESELAKTYADIAVKYLDTIYMGSASDASLFPELKAPTLPAVAALNAKAAGSSGYAQWYTEESQHTMEEFVLAHQFPPMVALERKNFWQISNAGKLILLAIVDPGGASKDSYLETAAQVARRNIYSVRSGWLDGVEWEKYVNELFMVTPEQVQRGTAVVYDAPNKQFYAADSPPGNEVELQELLDGALSKSIAAQNTERGFQKAAKRTFMQFVDFLEENPWAVVVLVLPVLGLGFVVFKASDEEKKD